MIRRCLNDCMVQILNVSVVLMLVFSTSNTRQCGPKSTETVDDGYVTIRNIGIKMCQLKCIEQGACLNFEYNIESLTCHLLVDESQKTEKEGYISLSKNHSSVPPCSCTSNTCSLGLRCLETRSGTVVCVQDGKQNCTDVSSTSNQDTSEDTPLHDACRKGDLEHVRCILSWSLVDVNSREKTEGRTPLLASVQNGRIEIFDFLVSKGANVSVVDDFGNNILHQVCMTENLDMVKHIVVHTSLDINSRSLAGRTPLMNAAYRGHRHVFEFLVSCGANVSHVDNSGRDILYWASIGGCEGMEKYVHKYIPQHLP